MSSHDLPGKAPLPTQGKPKVVKTVMGVPRCPDGSWSLTGYRRCKLPMGHTAQHEYEVRSYGR